MELLGPSAAGLCVLGIGICLFFVLAAGHIRIPDDPPDVDVELDLLYRRHHGDAAPDIGADTTVSDASPTPDDTDSAGHTADPSPALAGVPLARAS